MKLKYFMCLLGFFALCVLCVGGVGCSKAAKPTPSVSEVTLTKAPIIVPTYPSGEAFGMMQDSTPVEVKVVLTNPEQYTNIGAWLVSNLWVLIGLVLLFVEYMARITPTNTDNTIVGLIKRILDFFIPNAKSGGGFLK